MLSYAKNFFVKKNKQTWNCPNNLRYNTTLFLFFCFIFTCLSNTPDTKIFLWILTSAADAVAANPNVINTLLTYGRNTFFVNGKPTFSNGPRSLSRNPSDCIVLGCCIFEKFMLADDLFANTLRGLPTCPSINSSL